MKRTDDSLEILATILDYLPVPDQLRFARTSRRMREMVYDDTRWVSRLQSMGVWNEAEARQHFDEAMARRRRDAAAAAAAAAAATTTPGSGVIVPGAHGAATAVAGTRQASGSGGATMLFDASQEEERRRQLRLQQEQRQQQQQQELEQQRQLAQARDGFETLAIGGNGVPTKQPSISTTAAATDPQQDPEALLSVLKNVQSVRGHARQEYGKIYGALAPFYLDLQQAKSHADPAVFKAFRDPERQAQMLANLRVFGRSDWAQGWHQREEKLASMTSVFESAVLREFEQGYEFWDVDGRMRKYAHVLDVLSGSSAGIDLFIQKHPLFDDYELTNRSAMDCIHLAPRASTAPESLITLDPSRAFFAQLSHKVNLQSDIIARIFPRPARVFWALVDKVREDIVMEYITPLLDETHDHNLPAYLTAVSGLFEQCLQFLKELQPPKPPGADAKAAARAAAAAAEKQASGPAGRPGALKRKGTKTPAALQGGAEADGDEEEDEEDKEDAWRPRARLHKVKELAFRTFEPHLDLYLQEELDYFTKNAEAAVLEWDKKLSEQDADAESFYMANFNRQEVKKDFLSSFRKVVMMPVTVLPSLPGQLLGASPFGGGGSTSKSAAANDSNMSLPQPALSQSGNGSGRATPVPGGSQLPDKAPDDELAAKAALMTSRLEGIKSLFSLEMALNLVHAAKTSLGRAAVFVQLGGQAAGEAREQCETIFVVLLRVLGNGHVKQGFDRAVEHLSQYNPRAVSKPPRAAGGAGDGDVLSTEKNSGPDASGGLGDGGVAPLMTFIELVNVGDLISQMIDLFYEQQLAGPKIVDRNDFLAPAGLAKKRFEQMIDESVAAGLNKGIDVLMDEVEFICATTQKPIDYYPEAADAVAESGLFFLNGAGLGGGSGGASAATSPGAPGSAGGSSATAGDAPNSASHSSAFDPFAGGDIGPTATAKRVVALVQGHTNMLKGSTEKTMLDVFNGEVGLRLFTAVCKHLKRQRISMAGAVHVIADMTLYFDYVRTLRNPDLLAYFRALRELSQLYLIDARLHAKEMAVIIADGDRFGGVFRAEEVYEFAERRADWYQVKRDVERAMYGLECVVM